MCASGDVYDLPNLPHAWESWVVFRSIGNDTAAPPLTLLLLVIPVVPGSSILESSEGTLENGAAEIV